MPRNIALATAIRADGLTQAGLASKIRAVGGRMGIPNECSRGNIARWIDGGQPQQHYIMILTAVLGRTAGQLGLANGEPPPAPPNGGFHGDLAVPLLEEAAYGPLTGIWRSSYTYHSDSRGADFTEQHYCTLLQRGPHLAVRSLPRQPSQMQAGLWLEGQYATGTWAQRTAAGGYYRGTPYSGAAQLELDAAGGVLSGKWVGFGRRPGEINTGNWQFTRATARIDAAARDAWDHAPGDDDG